MFFVDDPVDPCFYDRPVLDALDDVPLRGLSTSPVTFSPDGPFPKDPVYPPSSPAGGAGGRPRDACTPEGSGSATTDTFPTPGLVAAPHKKVDLDGPYFGRDAPVPGLGPTGARAPPPRVIFYPDEWTDSLAHPSQRSQHHHSGQLQGRRQHIPRSCLYPISVLEKMTALVSKLPVPGTPFIPESGPSVNGAYEYLPPTHPTNTDSLPPAGSSVWQDIERWRSTVPAGATTLPPPFLGSTLSSSLPEFPYMPPPLRTAGTPFIPPLPADDPYIPPLPFEDAPFITDVPYIPPMPTEPFDPYIPPLSLDFTDGPSLRPSPPGVPYIPPLPPSTPTAANTVPGMLIDANTVPGLSLLDKRGRKRLREEGDLSPGRRHCDRSSREARDARWSRGEDGGW